MELFAPPAKETVLVLLEEASAGSQTSAASFSGKTTTIFVPLPHSLAIVNVPFI